MKRVSISGILIGVFFLSACGVKNVAFNTSSSSSCLNLDCSERKVNETVSLDLKSAPNDILFVLDDSASMNQIISNVRTGFASLSSSNFPNNTKMAVTYMSPDLFNADGSVNFGSAWYGEAEGTPGHLQLVTSTSIASFLSLGQQPTDVTNFPMKGCSAEWFSPAATNSKGERCLDGATQSPLYSTGVEAGVVSLDQMLQKATLNKKRIFRSGSFVNVIFVSDTHEPGANYWGKAGAAKKQDSLSDILSQINLNSSGIKSIKFSGVLPVPMVGDPALVGLNVIGHTPETPEEAHVSGEDQNPDKGIYGQFWDYSYIPFIKGTGGVITHPKNTDWTGIVTSIMEDANYSGTLVVPVSQPIESVTAVSVDGVSVDVSQVTINADLMSFNLKYASRSSSALSISVEYITKN